MSDRLFELKEMDTMPTEITITEPIGVGVGSITAPEMTLQQAELETQEIVEFRNEIDWRNPVVCFDGRTLEEGQEKLPLGAHMAGGAMTALVAAKAVGYHLEGASLLNSLKEKGLNLGAHVDTGNRDAEFRNGTGCGACDGCDKNCQALEDNRTEAKGIVGFAMGEDFDEKSFDELTLSNFSDDKNTLRNLVGEDLTEVLLDDGKGVHGHREQIAVFNYDENTTIDRDEYFAKTGKQAFVIDMWYIKKLANEMATGVDAEQQAKDLYHAMTSFQVATYIGLCDGSHRVAVLKSN